VSKSIKVLRIAADDDLDAVCAHMQPGKWGTDNEMTSYKPESLGRFLERGGLLLVALDNAKIAGAALCYKLPHPDGDDTLYVHELDTHPDFRRQGVATALMRELFKIAKERGLSEVWLGADDDNEAANALYRKLDPSDVDRTITYTYKVK
jgi:ribosomal protein S18 acetylase RimI-like enzyme